MPDQILLTEQNQGQSVDVRVGQPIVVSLPENATTGYRWAIDHLDSSLIDVRQASANYPSGPVGSAGRTEWRLLPKAAGTTQVTLKQWRPWEGDRSIVDRFSVRLRIGP